MNGKELQKDHIQKNTTAVRFKKCIAEIKIEELYDTEKKLGLSDYITPMIYNKFREYILNLSLAG